MWKGGREQRNDNFNFVSESTKIQAPVHISFGTEDYLYYSFLIVSALINLILSDTLEQLSACFTGLIRALHLLVLNMCSWRSTLLRKRPAGSIYIFMILFSFVLKESQQDQNCSGSSDRSECLDQTPPDCPCVSPPQKKKKSPLQQTILDLLSPRPWKLTQDWGQQPV